MDEFECQAFLDNLIHNVILMRVRIPSRGLSVLTLGLLVHRGALAEEPPAPSDAETVEVSADDSSNGATEDSTEKPPEGYVPGYRHGMGLSLAPYAPRSAPPATSLNVPFAVQDDDDGWRFKFSGFASASLRLSSGAREYGPVENQAAHTLHAAPRVPDFYGAFGGTNVTPGSWIDLHFEYGNERVQSHVTLTTWKPIRGQSWTDVRSQSLVDQAYVAMNLPVTDDLRLLWTVGAFRNIYGGLGQYGAGQYNTIIIGMPFGVGETMTAQYSLGGDYTLNFEHGVMGRMGKVAAGSGPTPFDPAQSAAVPSGWVHHAHLGLSKNGEIPWVVTLHYLTNWSQDERDQVDDPRTWWVDEGRRPDGRLSVYGFDARMINNHYGNAAVAVAYADAQDAALLTGMGFFGTVTGEELTKRFLGQRGGGNGQMFVGGFEYNLSWAKLLYHPEPFWGEGPDLITSIFSNVAHIHSPDPDFDRRSMVKFGTEVTYRMLKWFGVSGRYDHVIPNSKDRGETFDVISPKLIFRSDWNSHEQVTLSYTRWFYGPRTHAEFPIELPRERLDDQMFALHFGMWW